MSTLSSSQGKHYQVVIIGAGITGLYAAHKLKQAGIHDVLVVEANDRIGGRIRHVEGITPWPVQLGPEFIHGADNCLLKDLLDGLGWKLKTYAWPDYWYFAEENRLLNQAEGLRDVDVTQVQRWIDKVGTEANPPPGQDINGVDWMLRKGATHRQLLVAECCHANDFGGSLRQCGVREMIVECQKWTHGDDYLIPTDNSYVDMMNILAKTLEIKTSFPIAHIEWQDAANSVLAKIKLTCPRGSLLTCDHLLVTSSVLVLQSPEKMRFTPPLPVTKRAALARIGMGNAVKVILGFSERFWPEDLFDVCCPGGFIPELWTLPPYPSYKNKTGYPAKFAITCFFSGESANAVGNMPEAEAVRRCVDALDDMFGTRSDPKPGTRLLVAHCIADWSKEPYIMGGYTYPTHGVEDGDRATLAAPVSNRLFFAGEGTHEGLNPCIHGAMETAIRAVQEICEAVGVMKRTGLVGGVGGVGGGSTVPTMMRAKM